MTKANKYLKGPEPKLEDDENVGPASTPPPKVVNHGNRRLPHYGFKAGSPEALAAAALDKPKAVVETAPAVSPSPDVSEQSEASEEKSEGEESGGDVETASDDSAHSDGAETTDAPAEQEATAETPKQKHRKSYR